MVDGQTVQVTTNLEAALRVLRARRFDTLWIDAVCINQADLVERGLQVTRMGLIYSKAVEVVAWLGVEADDSALAFGEMHEASDRYVQILKVSILVDLFPAMGRVLLLDPILSPMMRAASLRSPMLPAAPLWSLMLPVPWQDQVTETPVFGTNHLSNH